MKKNALINREGQIKSWLLKMGIEKYTINEDFSVNVQQTVNLNNQHLSVIPIQFNEIIGSFYCNHNNLSTVQGFPKKVEGEFECTYNKISSFEKLDNFFVLSNIDVSHNELTSLLGLPKIIQGSLDASFNNINTLVSAPIEIKESFDLCSNQLTQIDFFPKVGAHIDLSFNHLTHLQKLPQIINGELNLSVNRLISLMGLPSHIKGDLNLRNNNLTTLLGVSDEIKGNLILDKNPLKKISTLPAGIETLSLCEIQMSSLLDISENIHFKKLSLRTQDSQYCIEELKNLYENHYNTYSLDITEETFKMYQEKYILEQRMAKNAVKTKIKI